MTRLKITIGSRGSDLALWQANHIQSRLEALGAEVSITIIKTKGDAIQHLSFDKIEGKGFFTKELEDALLERRIDLAVHSCKDLETNQPEGLEIAALSERADPADILLMNKSAFDPQELWNLTRNARVGTSSSRRKMQLTHQRPDLEIMDIRGNVPTRVEKLRSGIYEAIVLAKAGLDRLGLDLSDLQLFRFDPTQFIPAPAQGVLACQIRSSDRDLSQFLNAIHSPEVATRIGAERRVLNLFKGGCQLPLGAYCTQENGSYVLRAIMAPAYGEEPAQATLVANTLDGLPDKVVELLKKKHFR